MRKIALFCVICMLLGMVPVMAANEGPTVVIKNASQDIITVSGAAPIDTMVVIQIFNPGKSDADLDESGSNLDTASVQYFGNALSYGGAFTKDIKLNTMTGGTFTVVVTVAGTTTEIPFPYYPYTLKETYVERVDTETDATALASDLPEILKVFGFEFHALYTSTTDLAIAKEICNQNKGVTLANPDQAMTFLEEVIVVNAFNEDNELLKDDGVITYSTIWAKENSGVYADYSGELSEDGIANVNTALFAGTYNKVSEVYDTFEKSLLFELIMNNRLSGSGHIESVLSKYDTKYEALGFDLDLLDGASGKKNKFSSLLGSGAKDLDTLADKFNEIFDKNASSGSGSSSSGGGGGGGGGASSVGSVPSAGGADNYVPTVTETPTPTEAPQASGFSDVAESHWAYDAINYLRDAGVLNGRNEKTFAPDDLVTRAEFAKIIVEAFKLPETEGDISFGDCAADAWYTPFILRAAGNGVVTGYDGGFSPDKPITREDAAVIISRLFEGSEEATASFTDADEISDYAKNAIALLAQAGLINGVGDGKFAPKVNITRAQAARLVYNVLSGGENS